MPEIRQHKETSGILLETRTEALVRDAFGYPDDHVTRLGDDTSQRTAICHDLTGVGRRAGGDDVDVQTVLLVVALLRRAVEPDEFGIVDVALLQRHVRHRHWCGGRRRRRRVAAAGVEQTASDRQEPDTGNCASGPYEKRPTVHSATL